jgi:Flp pilus assembly protein TadG
MKPETAPNSIASSPGTSGSLAARRSGRRLRATNGQTVVEFALVLPILSLVLFGIIQFGLLFYNYIDLTSATREGARKAAVSRLQPNGVQLAKDAIAASTSVVDDSQTTITVTPGQPWTSGQDVDVKVTYPYSLNIMGIVLWSGPIKTESVIRVE